METGELPKRLLFDCTETEFIIFDAEQARHDLHMDSLAPWMVLRRGAGNIIEERPRKVVSWKGTKISIECEDGIVHLDLDEGTARKTGPQGELIYMGDIQEGNSGKGYIPVS